MSTIFCLKYGVQIPIREGQRLNYNLQFLQENLKRRRGKNLTSHGRDLKPTDLNKTSYLKCIHYLRLAPLRRQVHSGFIDRKLDYFYKV